MNRVNPQLEEKTRPSDWVKLIVGTLVIIGLIAGAIYFITSPSREKADIKKNGIEVTAVSNGEVFIRDDRVSKYSRKTTYKARYEFEGKDGRTYRVIGEKDYGSEANIKEGMKATIRYLEDDPYSPEFIREE